MVDNSSQQSNKQNNDLVYKEYEQAISLMQYHTGLLWQEFNAFLLAETVLLGFLGTSLAETKILVGNNILVFVGSLIGFLIFIPWLATFQHNYKYYELRVGQAISHELALGFTLLSEGRVLSSGKTVVTDDKKLQFPPLARYLPPHRSVSCLIGMFGAAFLLLMVITRP